MGARLLAILPRLIALSVIWLLGAATYSLAAGSGVPSATNTPSVASAGPKFLQVPDVRKQTYVFAEGILQDAGFADVRVEQRPQLPFIAWVTATAT